MKTWMYEAIVVWVVLAIVAYCSGNSITEWVGAIAVMAAFGHTQISDRLAERQKIKIDPDIPCYKHLLTYFFVKEAMWLAYFILHRSYAALVGVGLFLLYPAWRKFWRWYYPILPTRIVSIPEIPAVTTYADPSSFWRDIEEEKTVRMELPTTRMELPKGQ